jgi:hypothetical protein
MITSLYDRMKKANRERTLDLEDEVSFILRRLLARCKDFRSQLEVFVSETAA